MNIIWQKTFSFSYTRKDGLIVLHDADIPHPREFKTDQKYRSNVIFPSGARGGDHYHTKREEVFVGFGPGMTLIIEDPDTKKTQKFLMDPSHNDGKCVSFHIPTGLPHAVKNRGEDTGFLIELASHPQEKVEYQLSI